MSLGVRPVGGTRVEQSHLTTVSCDGVTIIIVRDGLFDALPESDDSAPLAAEVVAEFRSAVAGASAVVVDLRGAGEINKRTLNVTFRMVHGLVVIGARRALCGSVFLKQIWDLCQGGTLCAVYEEFEEARAAVARG